MTRPPAAAVAAGHHLTTAAAGDILVAGGNAFDAVVAAALTACVCEPMLCSLGGGGFLLARDAGGDAEVTDFFVQTPARKRQAPLDFRPIEGNFGNAVQEFHIGLGATAVPGCVAGLFDIQQRLGRMAMSDLIQPAVTAARDGVRLNRFQAYTLAILSPIIQADPMARSIWMPDGELLDDGAVYRLPEFAGFLEQLAMEGPDLFYRSELAAVLDQASAERGGHLQASDLARYQVIHRQPLEWRHGHGQVLSNPPPATGARLVALASASYQREATPVGGTGGVAGSAEHLRALTSALATMDQARHQLAETMDEDTEAAAWHGNRGTTHISIADRHGNLAGMTLSNGEGCGYMLPGTQIMLNNMLGEADLNPGGFHRWPNHQRVASMMAPSMVDDGERITVMGSGGSNRIRSVVFQVLSNLIDFRMSLADAIEFPRLHLEDGRLSFEDLLPAEGRDYLHRKQQDLHAWPERNLFFGGVNGVQIRGRSRHAHGDPRRGGDALLL